MTGLGEEVWEPSERKTTSLDEFLSKIPEEQQRKIREGGRKLYEEAMTGEPKMTMRAKLVEVMLESGVNPGLLTQAVDAVLSVLSEPSEAVIDAAYDAYDKFEQQEEGAWCGLRSAFRAMLNAIKEGA